MLVLVSECIWGGRGWRQGSHQQPVVKLEARASDSDRAQKEKCSAL